ncbi:MAG: outer membrane beta-barrel protein [Gammaproteobacteria bacterium]|jgi:opacity protein-like surface antigen|nr:outer membrane beta-barrel protein [Gammaproteobacteria bacterium]
MNKLKTALCLSVALLATSAQAQWQGNWVLGVSGAYNWFGNDNDDNNLTIFHNTTGRVTSLNFGNNFNDDDDRWGWGLLGGYQAKCNGWLLGLELAIDWLDHDGDDNGAFVFTDNNLPRRVWAGTADWDRDYVLALTGRWGYEMSPYFMPYLRAGVETSRDKASFQLNTADNLLPFLTAADDGHRQSWRFVGGIGAEVPVPVVAGLGLRAEWNYHSSGRNIDTAALANDNGTLIVVDGDSHHTNTAKLSLVYNFPG